MNCVYLRSTKIRVRVKQNQQVQQQSLQLSYTMNETRQYLIGKTTTIAQI